MMSFPVAANTADSDTAVPKLAAFQVESGVQDAVAFSPNGTLLATGGRDNQIHIRDVATGDLIRSIEGHTEWVTSLAFNDTGRVLVSGSKDNSVRTFDLQTGGLMQVITHHRGDITAVDFTPDGEIIASGGRDSTILLHHAESAQQIAKLDHFGGPVWDLAFSPDGNMLASSSEEGAVWLWGLWSEDGAWLKRLDGHDGPVASLAFSENGDYLLTGGLDSTLRLWDLRDVKARDTIEAELVMRGHFAPVMGAGFSTDNSVAMSASLDGTVRLWDMSNGLNRGEVLSAIETDGTPITSMALNPSRSLLASTATDGTLNLWNTDNEVLRRIRGQDEPAVIQRDPNRSASVSSPDEDAPTLPARGRTLYIPGANIESALTSFPLGEITWEIDPWEPLVGHFAGTAWLNQTGNVVLGGHAEYPNGQPGVFYNLTQVGIGDEIYVQDGALQRRYVVVNVRSVDYRDVSVVYPTSNNRLTLVTCDIPSYVAAENRYYERLVVIADEVPQG
jgi:LPXTG-site transpeptidase (sortase) family protein